MKYINFHRCKTWDGLNKKTIRTVELIFCIFNLRLSIYIRSYDDDHDEPSSYRGFAILYKHIVLFEVFWYRWKGFKFYALNDPIRILFKRIWNFNKIRKLNNKIDRINHHAMLVCSDPMNGCPDDFAEHFNKEIRSIEHEIDKLYY